MAGTDTGTGKRGRLPSLDLLKGFESAARLGSFTRAATELHLTQSAISRQVQGLEEQLGVRLFERSTRSLALTPAGARLQRAAGEVLQRLRDVVDALQAEAGGPLTVTTTVTFASLWLVPRLSRFQALHPGVDVRLAANNAVKDLSRDGIDLAIRYCRAAEAGTGAVRLFGERVVPVCSPALLASRRLKQPADLARHALLHYEDPGVVAPWLSWSTWFEALGLPPLRAAGSLRFDHYDQMLRAAAAGQGIALGRVPLVDAFLDSGQLVAPLARKWSTSAADRAFWALCSPASATRPEAQAFMAWLREEAASVSG